MTPLKPIVILTGVLILFIISFKLNNPKSIIPLVERFSKKFLTYVGYFTILFFIFYAIDLRYYYETKIKYTETNEFGKPIEQYKTDNNLIYNVMPDGTVIDLTGNYKNYKILSNKMWMYICIGYGLLVFYLIYNRKVVLENLRSSKMYKFIQNRRTEENENQKIK